tara:strand:- start:1070 stop:1843 length:774 start_codon:yes stop_codon:yes gene_type:complete
MWSFLAVAVYIIFIVNIPFYIYWLKNQKQTKEAFLYNVEGKHSYDNVLDLVNRIEVETNSDLSKEKRIILVLKQACDRRKAPLLVYKKKIHRLLKDKAFGKNMATTAFKRMPTYSKVMALLDVGILLSILNAFAYAFSDDVESTSIGTRIGGIVVGFIPAAPLWFIAHMTFNYSLKYSAERSLTKKETAGYFQIAMAHYYGFFLGMFWKDLMWENKKNQFLLGPEYVNYGFGSFGSSFSGYSDFYGGDFGGAGGDWS